MVQNGDRQRWLKIKIPNRFTARNFFFVAEAGLFYDPFWLAAQTKSPAAACGVCRDFCFSFPRSGEPDSG